MGWLIAWVWQGAVLVGLVTLALRRARRIGAATRYVVWWWTMAAVIALPWLVAMAHGPGASEIVSPGSPGAAPGSGLGVVELPGLPVEVAIAAILCWLVLTGVRLACLARGIWNLLALKARCVPLERSIEARLPRWMAVRRCGRDARVRVSEDVVVASALGLTRPVIALPSSFVERLTSDELDQVVLHEYAHLLRWDDWARVIQVALEAVFLFHPAVWWTGRALNLEREAACDDWVVARRGRQAYARCLARVARASRRGDVGLAPGMAVSPTALAQRVTRVLDRHRNRTGRISTRVALTSVMALVLAVLFVDRWSPRVAFGPTAVRVPAVDAEPLESVRASARSPLEPQRDGLTVSVPAPAVPGPRPAPGVRAASVQSRSFGPILATAVRPEPLADEVPSALVAPVPLAAAPIPWAGTGAIGDVPGPRALVRGTQDVLLSRGGAEASAQPEAGGVRYVWSRTTEAGAAIGEKTKKAGIATAGFFSRVGKSIARIF